jgi:hypothetical protein
MAGGIDYFNNTTRVHIMKKSNIYLFNMIQSSRSHKDHIMGERGEPHSYL